MRTSFTHIILLCMLVQIVLADNPPAKPPTSPVVVITPPKPFQSPPPVQPAATTASSSSVSLGSCEFEELSTGKRFDLSSLQRYSQSDYYRGVDTLYDYYLNICGGVSDVPECQKHGSPSICQVNKGSQTYVAKIANFQQLPRPHVSYIQPSNPTKGLELTFTNGDICFINGIQIQRRAVINLPCAPQTSSKFDIYEEANTCVFHITLPTHATCPDALPGQSLPFFGILFVWIVVGVSVYFGGFYLYNSKRYGLTGLDAFPHGAFVKTLFKDGPSAAIRKLLNRKDAMDDI